VTTKEQLREVVQQKLPSVLQHVNAALSGERRELERLAPVLARIGRGARLPHWFEQLRHQQTLPNLDGKTIGSVVEMLLLAVLETSTLKAFKLPPLRVNPARGVDLPDLDLGVKSPSENFCTSEPFFSAYERLYGSEHDALVLLTDYQQKKRTPPLRLQITRAEYLTKTQIADEGLCKLARQHRAHLLKESEGWAKKVFRFLSFVNQSDWRARQLLKLLEAMLDDSRVHSLVKEATLDFVKQNKARERKDRELIPDAELKALQRIVQMRPLKLGIVDALDNWVLEVLREAGRPPSENEWNRLLSSPLDGRIGMSFALQWRYNFGRVFGVEESEPTD
jgi:hypothetical protein